MIVSTESRTDRIKLLYVSNSIYLGKHRRLDDNGDGEGIGIKDIIY